MLVANFSHPVVFRRPPGNRDDLTKPQRRAWTSGFYDELMGLRPRAMPSEPEAAEGDRDACDVAYVRHDASVDKLAGYA